MQMRVPRGVPRLLAALTLALTLAAPAAAQAPPGADTTAAAPATDTTTTPRRTRVVDVYRLGVDDAPDGTVRRRAHRAGIGDIIVVEVEGMSRLLAAASCTDPVGRADADCQTRDIALFLDGREIKSIQPESGAPQPEPGDRGTFQFHLQRTTANDEAWVDLLGNPSPGPHFFYRPTSISVGLEDRYPVLSDVDDFELVRIRKTEFWVCQIGFLLLLILFFMLARQSDLLRDLGPAPTGVDARGRPRQKPYSLARCQMAFWFILVIASLLFIWQITGAYDIVTPSVLALIGIGSGTALGSAAIDVSKRNDVVTRRAALEDEQTTLQKEVATLDTQIAAAAAPAAAPADVAALQNTKAAKEARLQIIAQDLQDLQTPVAPKVSEGFVLDILSDTTGVSFHRFQMFTWTVVLGFIFVTSVWIRLSMPEFSATLLALQGISAGTYLGFKIPEEKT